MYIKGDHNFPQVFRKDNFLAASSAQSSKKRFVVVVVGIDFQSQHLSKKKGKYSSDWHGSMNEDFKMEAGGQDGRTAEWQNGNDKNGQD